MRPATAAAMVPVLLAAACSAQSSPAGDATWPDLMLPDTRPHDLYSGPAGDAGADPYSGLPNTYPPVYPTLATQADRAARYRAYVEGGAATPWMVGWHWFQHSDQPKEGRFEGENCNWGVVNIKDEPYKVVVDEMARVSRRAYLLHRGWLPATGE